MLDLKNCPFCDASDNDDNACQEAGVICTEVPTAVGARGWQVVCRCGVSSPKQLTAAEAIAAWNRRAIQAVGPEPAVAGVETCKFYHSQWPVEDRLKARGPYGLITDDGEAWRYEYTHSDADGGPYDVVCRPRSALVATPPAETVVEAHVRTGAHDKDGRELCAGDRIVYRNAGPHTKEDYWNPEYEVVWRAPRFVLKYIGGGKNTDQASFAFLHTNDRYWREHIETIRAALATKPAVKDDETVVEALPLREIRRRVRNIWGAISSNQVIDKDVEGQAKRLLADIDAALAAKDGRS